MRPGIRVHQLDRSKAYERKLPCSVRTSWAISEPRDLGRLRDFTVPDSTGAVRLFDVGSLAGVGQRHHQLRLCQCRQAKYLLKHELLHALVIVLTTQPHKTFLRFCINFPQATLPATAAYRYQSVACRTELFRTSPGLLADQRLAAGQHLPRTSQRHSCRRQHRRGCTSSTMPLTCANLERRWSTSRLQVKRTT